MLAYQAVLVVVVLVLHLVQLEVQELEIPLALLQRKVVMEEQVLTRPL
jgi:hypothetical protein